MADRPRFLDDIAGVAGGAFSALAGLREEVESLVRGRIEETMRRLDLATRADLDAAHELASLARAGQEDATARIVTLEQRVAALEQRAGVANASHPLSMETQATADQSSYVAPGTMPEHEDHTTDRPADASYVTPASMVPDSGDPGSLRSPPGGTGSSPGGTG